MRRREKEGREEINCNIAFLDTPSICRVRLRRCGERCVRPRFSSIRCVASTQWGHNTIRIKCGACFLQQYILLVRSMRAPNESCPSAVGRRDGPLPLLACVIGPRPSHTDGRRPFSQFSHYVTPSSLPFSLSLFRPLHCITRSGQRFCGLGILKIRLDLTRSANNEPTNNG